MIRFAVLDMVFGSDERNQGYLPNPELLESLTISRCRLSGKEMQIVMMRITIRRSISSLRTAWSPIEGKMNATTWGIVSPLRNFSTSPCLEAGLTHMMTLNAHMLSLGQLSGQYHKKPSTPSECKCKLKERNGSCSPVPKDSIHDLYVSADPKSSGPIPLTSV